MVLVTLTGCVSSGQEFGSVSSTAKIGIVSGPQLEKHEYTLPRSRSELSKMNSRQLLISQCACLTKALFRGALSSTQSEVIKVGSGVINQLLNGPGHQRGRHQWTRRYARQLDRALGEQISVDPAYVEVVSLYRILENKTG